jgi:hypothetical protein
VTTLVAGLVRRIGGDDDRFLVAHQVLVLREILELQWGAAVVNTWNSRRAGVLSWLGWCRERGCEGPMVPAWAKRLAVPDSETPARSKMAIDRLVARREVHLREKTLWRMLYGTAARAEEILGVNIEDLDFAGRRCLVKAKGARSKARRRGQAREDTTALFDEMGNDSLHTADDAAVDHDRAVVGAVRAEVVQVELLGLVEATWTVDRVDSRPAPSVTWTSILGP